MFACPDCDEYCPDKGTLKRHIKDTHRPRHNVTHSKESRKSLFYKHPFFHKTKTSYSKLGLATPSPKKTPKKQTKVKSHKLCSVSKSKGKSPECRRDITSRSKRASLPRRLLSSFRKTRENNNIGGYKSHSGIASTECSYVTRQCNTDEINVNIPLSPKQSLLSEDEKTFQDSKTIQRSISSSYSACSSSSSCSSCSFALSLCSSGNGSLPKFWKHEDESGNEMRQSLQAGHPVGYVVLQIFDEVKRITNSATNDDWQIKHEQLKKVHALLVDMK